VVDYRVVRTSFNAQTNEAVAQVEIDYYTLSTNRLRSLIDTQKWAYVKAVRVDGVPSLVASGFYPE
jgi:hypothetical protein